MIDYVGKIAENLLRERGAYTMKELKGEINFEFARIYDALDEALALKTVDGLKKAIEAVIFKLEG